MWHKPPDLNNAQVRSAHPADHDALVRLIYYGRRGYFSEQGYDLEALLATALGVVLTHGDELWAAALATPPRDGVAWLVGLGMIDGLGADAVIAALFSMLRVQLRARDAEVVFFSGSASTHFWPLQPLIAAGFERATEVLSYQKRNFTTPAGGNPLVIVRPACTDDVAILMALDHACFSPEWRKDAATIGAAFALEGHVLIAELESVPVGYAILSRHHHGQLMHLVRIAVVPQHQGQGIGMRLLAEVVDMARAHNAEVLSLNTQAYNTHARRLYEWFGFRLTGDRQLVLRCHLVP